jgi:hypothetical protein
MKTKIAETKSSTAPDSEPRIKAAPTEPVSEDKACRHGVDLEHLALEAMGVCRFEDDDNPTLTALDGLIAQLDILRLALEYEEDERPFGKALVEVVNQLTYRVYAIREIAAMQEVATRASAKEKAAS